MSNAAEVGRTAPQSDTILRGELTHSGHGGQQAGALVDRRQEFSHISIHFG